MVFGVYPLSMSEYHLNQAKLSIRNGSVSVWIGACFLAHDILFIWGLCVFYSVVKWFAINSEGDSINNLGCWHCRCEIEERNTRSLEQQVALLRESKRKADESSVMLQAEFHRSMTELQGMHEEFEVTICTTNPWYDIFFIFSGIYPSS